MCTCFDSVSWFLVFPILTAIFHKNSEFGWFIAQHAPCVYLVWIASYGLGAIEPDLLLYENTEDLNIARNRAMWLVGYADVAMSQSLWDFFVVYNYW